MSHAYAHARGLEDIASCPRCRCLIILGAGRARIWRRVNPYASDREWIAGLFATGKAQGFQGPGGSAHRNCSKFLWTS